MLGQLWWATSVVTAFIALVARLSPRLTVTEIAFASIPVGTIGGAWITYLVSGILNEISATSLVISTIALFYVAGTHWNKFERKLTTITPKLSQEFFGNKLLWLNLAVWGYFVVPLYQSRFFPEDDKGNVFSGGSCWADLPIHLHIAHSFLYGRNRDVSFGDMQSPVFAGERMAYPFLPDWHAAILNYLGDSMRHAMMNPGIAMFFSLVALLFCFGRRMVNSGLASSLAIILVILAGGMGGINLSRVNSFEELMQKYDPIQDDVGQSQQGQVFWFAFLPHVYLPQRGATFAYPMALTSLLLVWVATAPARSMPLMTARHRRTCLVLAAVFAASLPLVQAHSFIALGVAIGVLFLLETPKLMAHPIQLVGWLTAGVFAVALALPQLAGYINTVTEGGPNGKGTFMEIRPIWSPPPYSYPANFVNFWWFWFRATGPALPLITVALVWWSLPAVQIAAKCTRVLLDFTSEKGPGAGTPGHDHCATSPVDPDVGSVDSEDGEPLEHQQVYSYGGKMVKAQLTPHQAEDLRQLVDTVQSHYEPIADLAAYMERVIDSHNEGRVYDAFKFGLCGVAVWMFGNLVMLQPWDRDNCKLLYIALFLMMPLSAKMLVFPLEHLWRLHTGWYRRAASSVQKKRDDVDAAVSEASSMRQQAAVPSIGPLKRKPVAAIGAVVAGLVLPFVLYYSCYSGALSVIREHRLYHVLYDRDARAVGEYMREHVEPKAVMLHHDTHLTPAGYYAGRPTLVAYTGWMWSHGYNYHDRHRDRNIILDHMLKDSDSNVYNLLRRWGVRYVLGENPRAWPRNTKRKGFNEDMFLDKKLKRVYTAGRYQLFEVLGYGFPPS